MSNRIEDRISFELLGYERWLGENEDAKHMDVFELDVVLKNGEHFFSENPKNLNLDSSSSAEDCVVWWRPSGYVKFSIKPPKNDKEPLDVVSFVGYLFEEITYEYIKKYGVSDAVWWKPYNNVSEEGKVMSQDNPVEFHGNFKDFTDDQKDAVINPKHYKIIPKEAYAEYPDGMEYMDIMRYALARHKGVVAHALGHVFKYAFRLGGKDDELQDATKISWYANHLKTILSKEG